MGVNTVFFIASHTIQLAMLLLWPLSFAWVVVDSGRRIRHRGQRRLALAVAVLPLLGPLLYRAFRPPEYVEDRRLREAQRRALERRETAGSRCPSCRREVRPDFLSCAHCGTRLREPCRSCGEPLDLLWACCPWCETEVESPPAFQPLHPAWAQTPEPSLAAGRAAAPAPERAA